MNFPWHHKVIYHEAGVPPIHTPISYLSTLPKEVQKKVTVYHIAKKDMLPDTHLTLAKFGIEHTVYPPITPPKHEEAYRILVVLSRLEIFRNFPIAKAKEFLAIVEEERYKRDEKIIEKNSYGDKFFIIVSGNVKVESMEQDAPDGSQSWKRYGSYDYFGEASLISDEPRSADVFAETDVVALTIEKAKFLNFIRGSDLDKQLATLNEVRKTGTWDVLNSSEIFRGATSAQKTQLELFMELRQFSKGDKLIECGKLFQAAYIIKTGQVEVRKDGELEDTLNKGDFCGEIYKLQRQMPSSFDFVASSDLEVYSLERSSMIEYIANNPGVYMRLNKVYD